MVRSLALAREFVDRLPGEEPRRLVQAVLHADALNLCLLGTDRLAQTGDAQAERRRQADLAIESLRAAVAAGFND